MNDPRLSNGHDGTPAAGRAPRQAAPRIPYVDGGAVVQGWSAHVIAEVLGQSLEAHLARRAASPGRKDAVRATFAAICKAGARWAATADGGGHAEPADTTAAATAVYGSAAVDGDAMSVSSPIDGYLTAQQAAARLAEHGLGGSVRNVTDLAARGRISAHRHAGRWWFRSDDIDAYIESRSATHDG